MPEPTHFGGFAYGALNLAASVSDPVGSNFPY